MGVLHCGMFLDLKCFQLLKFAVRHLKKKLKALSTLHKISYKQIVLFCFEDVHDLCLSNS